MRPLSPFLLFLLILVPSLLRAQDVSEMQVVEGSTEIANGYIVATQSQNRDANGEIAGAIMVETDLQGLAFESGLGILRSDNKPGQYILFVSPGEKRLRILSPNHVPLNIFLPDVGIRIKSGQTWKIQITGDKKVDKIPVTIRTEPKDALRFIDGEAKGREETIPLPLGTHELRLEKVGYRTLVKTFEVTSERAFFEEELEEIDPVLFTIRTEPKGATILVDGIEEGQSDLQVFKFPGRYRVKAQLSGYVEEEKEIEVEENGSNEVRFELEKNTASLDITTVPDDARLLLNNREVERKGVLEVAPGMYRIEVEAKGYRSYSETLELSKGKMTQKKVVLEAITGGLQVVVSPIEAQVVLKRDGKNIEQWEGAKLLRNLKVGEYAMVVTAEGYESQTLAVKIEEGRRTALSVNLEERQSKNPRASRSTVSAGETMTNSIGMEFVLIPAGSFEMGSNDGDDNEKPVHRVTITTPFYIGKYEVTQAEFNAFVDATGYRTEAEKGDGMIVWTGSNWEKKVGSSWKTEFVGTDRPVIGTSWNDSQEFVKWLNEKEGGQKYRLPTEAEWEYAARAGTSTKWSFGDDENDLGMYAWYDGNSGYKTHPVGQKKTNPWGLYDMHGNVWEWCQDRYGFDYYQSSPTRDPQGGSSGSIRMIRGGSWINDAGSTRSAFRQYNFPRYRRYDIGFRLVRLQ